MKLKKLLVETLSKNEVEKLFLLCIKKYFSEYYSEINEWGIPKFTLVDMPSKAGLFVYIPRKGSIANPVLKINKDFNTESFYKPVIYHETIHYIQANLVARNLPPYESGKWKDPHDAYFHKMAEKINSIEGENFITATHDVNKHGSPTMNTPIYVYGFFYGSKPGFVWSKEPSDKLNDYILQRDKPFKFETQDFWYKNSQLKVNPTTTKSLKFGIISDPDRIEFIKTKLI
jgi:hypothetical protein